MGLNKSKGNMYGFVTHTYNTIKGACSHDCSYCYMKRFGALNPVRFDEKELNTDLGSGNYIFVGSSCDMWADDIPYEWIRKTIDHCEKFDNSYFLQTKNPKAFGQLGVEICSLKHFSLCITLESNTYYEAMGNAPHPINRCIDFAQIPFTEKYITIEPIMDFHLDSFVAMIRACNPIQVNIGADSGRNGLTEPPKEKVLELIAALNEFTVVHNKSNLKRML